MRDPRQHRLPEGDLSDKISTFSIYTYIRIEWFRSPKCISTSWRTLATSVNELAKIDISEDTIGR